MRAMDGLRWTFRVGSWRPDLAEWSRASQYVQPEEKARIGGFVFKRDARSAMAGRLLIRKAVSDCLRIEYPLVRLGRTEKGKPTLENETREQFSFNVSHQGEYAILAAEKNYNVGVDVMKTEMPRGKSLVEYFHTMRRQLTKEEWETINSYETERERLASFYRFWCLKESYVKALGIGIGFTLSRLSFQLQTPRLGTDHVVSDTRLFVDGERAEEWTFEEIMLDSEHTAAVALTPISESTNTQNYDSSSRRFRALSFAELTDCAVPISEPDHEYWAAFNAKEEKPPGFRS